MKLTKQNQVLLGVGALAVVGYLLWKQNQKKQEFLGMEKPKPKPQPDTNFKRYRLLSDFYTESPTAKTFKRGQIVSGIEVSNVKTGETFLQVRELLPGGALFFYIPMNLVQQLRDRRDILNIGKSGQSEGNKKMFVEDNMIIQSSNWE